jgi:dTDP-L-rhamnose 4-epimerase
LGIDIEPTIPGEFRPGEMRHLISDITRMESIGYRPTVEISEGIERYLDWIRLQGDVRDYFAEAERHLKEKRVVQTIEITSS